MSDFDSTAALQNSAAINLASLLNAGSEQARLWRPEELSAIFKHQLAAPILIDLSEVNAVAAERLRVLVSAQNLLLKSFADLFHHPLPPIELLTLTKEFAKSNMDHPGSILPHEVASVLYYLSIATAQVRLQVRLSQLPEAELRKGFLWASGQPWIDERTRVLLIQGIAQIESGSQKKDGLK